MVKDQRNRLEHYFFYILFCLSLGLMWFFHKEATKFTDRDELWSDRAGYYIYLPSVFFYHFDTQRMPPDLDVQTGGGFSIDTLHNKIDTKYTYGVALLASPFFVTAGLISRIAGYHSESGFSMIYMRMMALAAVVYLLLGLWLLKKFLNHYFQPVVSYFVVLVIFLGTNLFFYSLIDGMMSHVYSFFLFALFLFGLKKFLVSNAKRWFILVCVAFSLAVLIRPTNIILGLLFFSWDADGPSGWMKRIRIFVKPAYILPFLAIIFIAFLPQFAYWKYLSGNWLHFSYRDEGFTSWAHPRILEVLFSPVNGLIPYTPLVMIFLAGTFMMIWQKQQNGWLVAAVFLVVTLVCASWKMWYFGCSFGQRSFIEYYALMAVPFGYFMTWVFSKRSIVVQTVLLFVVFVLVYFNLRYTVALYQYERCYYGSTWDWDHYFRSVERAGVISPVRQVQSFENDFENLALSPVFRPSKIFTRSGLYSVAANDKSGITPLFSIRLDEFRYPYPKRMEVELWALKPGSSHTGASLEYTLSRGQEILFRDGQPLDSVLKSSQTWSKVVKTFIIPDVFDSSLLVRMFLRNPGKAMVFVDDLRIRYRYGWR